MENGSAAAACDGCGYTNVAGRKRRGTATSRALAFATSFPSTLCATQTSFLMQITPAQSGGSGPTDSRTARGAGAAGSDRMLDCDRPWRLRKSP